MADYHQILVVAGAQFFFSFHLPLPPAAWVHNNNHKIPHDYLYEIIKFFVRVVRGVTSSKYDNATIKNGKLLYYRGIGRVKFLDSSSFGLNHPPTPKYGLTKITKT